MLIGGLGSIYGAMAGGLLLGIVEVLSVAYLASSYRDAFAFCLMIVVLAGAPARLVLHRHRRERVNPCSADTGNRSRSFSASTCSWA